MFGRQSREEREAEQRRAKQEILKKERAEYWSWAMANAKDEHEELRLYIAYQNEQLLDWLTDFDRRSAAEMREHSKKLQGFILALAGALVVHHWL